MAVTLGDAWVMIRGDSAPLEKEMRGAEKKTRGFASGLTKNVQRVGKLALGALAGVAAGAGATILKTGAEAFSFSQQMEGAMGTLQGQLGATNDEMAQYRDVAEDVFTAGYGESVGDIATAMKEVNGTLGEQGERLEDSTRRALTLRDVFGVDVAEGVSAAGTAVQAGLVDTSERAFDLITTGFQNGLNQAGDFGDTIREYSSDFERLGFSGEEFLSVLNAGLEEGAWNTDVIADGVREFGIRFGAAEDTAVEALESIGINAEELYEGFQDGSVTTADAMEIVTERLAETDDKTLRAQAGAALFGSKWEDIGEDVFLAAGQAREGIEGIEGATDKAGEGLRRGLGPALQELKRTAIVALTPITDLLGGILTQIVNQYGPIAISMLQSLGASLEVVALKVGQVLASSNPLQALIAMLPANIQALLADIQALLAPVTAWIQSNVKLQDVLLALGIAIGAVVIPILWGFITTVVGIAAPVVATFAAVMAAVVLLRKAWESNFLGIQNKAKAVWGFLQAFIPQAVERIRALVTKAITAIKLWWAQNGDQILAKARAIWTTIQNVISAISSTIQAIISTFLDAVQTFWSNHGDAIMTAVENTWEGLKAIIDNFRGIIEGIVEAFHAALEGDFHAVGEALRKVWDNLWGTIKEIVSTAVENIITTFSDVNWGEVGRSVVEGIANGLRNAAGIIADAAKNAAKNAYQAAKGFLGINCPDPSPIFAELGIGMGEGMVQGLGMMDRAIQGAAAGLVGSGAVSADRAGRSLIDRSRSMTVHLTGNYKPQTEPEVTDDIRLLAMQYGMAG